MIKLKKFNDDAKDYLSILKKNHGYKSTSGKFHYLLQEVIPNSKAAVVGESFPAKLNKSKPKSNLKKGSVGRIDACHFTSAIYER